MHFFSGSFHFLLGGLKPCNTVYVYIYIYIFSCLTLKKIHFVGYSDSNAWDITATNNTWGFKPYYPVLA